MSGEAFEAKCKSQIKEQYNIQFNYLHDFILFQKTALHLTKGLDWYKNQQLNILKAELVTV